MIRTASFRANGRWHRIAVKESDEQIRAKVDELYGAAEAGDKSAVLRLGIWLGIEETLCPLQR